MAAGGIPALSDDDLLHMEEMIRAERTRRQTERAVQAAVVQHQTAEMEKEKVRLKQEMQEALLQCEEERLCDICLDNNQDCVFSCGHQTCLVCAHPLTVCPFCSQRIQQKLKTYNTYNA